jgi:hypothetical protein
MMENIGEFKIFGLSWGLRSSVNLKEIIDRFCISLVADFLNLIFVFLSVGADDGQHWRDQNLQVLVRSDVFGKLEGNNGQILFFFSC